MKQEELQKKMLQCSSLKSMQIIIAISSAEDYTSIVELSKITGLSASTIHRILNELMECGFVVKDEKQKKFKLGFESVALSMKIQVTDYLADISREEMAYLNNLSGETVNLVTLNGYEGVYIAKMEAKNQIALKSKVGWRIPLYCTSSGKVLLSCQNESWLDGYFKNITLNQFTKNTVTDRRTLEIELKKIKIQGYAMDIKEHNQDIICLAAPIFSHDRKCVGTIGIAAPDYRFTEEKALSYLDDVMKAAQSITNKLL
ncbi:IclR family transcriptional regulator [Anaerocolumna sp. MB42-C2]|uniref:IclR family transcriptional regulator n=1 Tax=Anaerocolumna sp. MB42-C2 TaxID=3070997 RepID=UPI0027E0D194|nr:IclR family transcriptional regulator [Anaerocolumna sp. MB42-C2]WMJ86500.1 IclR family transcriptional regulator [Anaerocolumna sp. MB42-C2]